MAKRVLIVEDEHAIMDILVFNLQKDGYEALSAYDGQEGLSLALSENPDLVLLDVMLPKMDGFEVCGKIRKTSQVPIIMLTAREEETDKVMGLELGADDYITKPFSVRELMARVKANIRRFANADQVAISEDAQSDIIKIGEIAIDDKNYSVTKNGASVELTLREYELLKYFMNNNKKVFTREDLMENVWKFDYFGDVRTVDVTVRRLREKIETDPANPEYIRTKRGIGYYFEGTSK